MGIGTKIYYAYYFVLLLRAVIWIGVCFFCATEWLEFFMQKRFFYERLGFELLLGTFFGEIVDLVVALTGLRLPAYRGVGLALFRAMCGDEDVEIETATVAHTLFWSAFTGSLACVFYLVSSFQETGRIGLTLVHI
jgi:hypothetical protein